MNIERLPEHNILLDKKYVIEARIKELVEQERNEFWERAKVYVGKCYRYAGTDCFFKIVNVPQIEWTMTGSIFNEYQFPALFIDEEEDIPFYNDTVYLSLDIGIPEETPSHFSKKVEEIGIEEFNSKLDAVYEKWIKNV